LENLGGRSKEVLNAPKKYDARTKKLEEQERLTNKCGITAINNERVNKRGRFGKKNHFESQEGGGIRISKGSQVPFGHCPWDVTHLS